ncbi:hypothetical protein EV190_11711 [Actinorugispora endophytica]|uniref:Uncharacterized protein n=1 Tax=Actinorugispora endophytica TaxID=1605990 RepID=A0A4R6URB6_9ACTN|nr:hypothetical protein EV190_11711 [Actinorugispora endophytica]
MPYSGPHLRYLRQPVADTARFPSDRDGRLRGGPDGGPKRLAPGVLPLHRNGGGLPFLLVILGGC